MSKGRHKFREVEVRRAVKAVQSAGVKVARIEINDAGTIAIFPSDDAASGNAVNEWDGAE